MKKSIINEYLKTYSVFFHLSQDGYIFKIFEVVSPIFSLFFYSTKVF